MKKLTAGVVVALMVVMGTALATAAELPQALNGVNLSTAQVLTPDQAQQIKGASQGWENWENVSWHHKFGVPPGANSAQGEVSRSWNSYVSGRELGEVARPSALAEDHSTSPDLCTLSSRCANPDGLRGCSRAD